MKKIVSLLAMLFVLSACQTTARFISEKDAWIAMSSAGSDSIYYCERVPVKDGMAPICTPAVTISDKYVLDKLHQKTQEQKEAK